MTFSVFAGTFSFDLSLGSALGSTRLIVIILELPKTSGTFDFVDIVKRLDICFSLTGSIVSIVLFSVGGVNWFNMLLSADMGFVVKDDAVGVATITDEKLKLEGEQIFCPMKLSIVFSSFFTSTVTCLFSSKFLSTLREAVGVLDIVKPICGGCVWGLGGSFFGSSVNQVLVGGGAGVTAIGANTGFGGSFTGLGSCLITGFTSCFTCTLTGSAFIACSLAFSSLKLFS